MKKYSKDDEDSVMPELSLSNEPKVDVSSISHHSIKSDVVCSPNVGVYEVSELIDKMFEENFILII